MLSQELLNCIAINQGDLESTPVIAVGKKSKAADFLKIVHVFWVCLRHLQAIDMNLM